MEKRALGKGLSALIPQKEIITENISVATSDSNQEKILRIPTSAIKTNKYQPRFDFNQEKLADLVNSIKEKGIVQPILVRKTEDGFELIAGERRLRAAKTLNLDAVPAIVKDVADIDMLELSLIENIQREGLNPIEEARAFQKFITDFQFTQEKIAQALGKDRSTIANTLRLLSLPKKIQDYISQGLIMTGHAKAILGLPTEISQVKMSESVVRNGLSVRETENAIARRAAGLKKIVVAKDANLVDIEGQLQKALGTRVRIFHGKKRGRIQIDYYSLEDLNRLLNMLASSQTSAVAAGSPEGV
jgi:ParB family chromosome partitioning protein